MPFYLPKNILFFSEKGLTNSNRFVGLLSFSSIDISTNNYTSNSSLNQGSKLRLALFCCISENRIEKKEDI